MPTKQISISQPSEKRALPTEIIDTISDNNIFTFFGFTSPKTVIKAMLHAAFFLQFAVQF